MTNSGFSDALGTYNFTYYQVPNEYKYELNKYYTIIETYDGKNLAFYINGELVSSIEVIGNIKLINLPIIIGFNPGRDSGPYISKMGVTYSVGGGSVNATFTDALIFDRSMDSNEIAKDYGTVINPTNLDGLLLRYKFA